MHDLLVASIFVAMVVSPTILGLKPRPANLKNHPIFSRRSSRDPLL
jgi:hypothetical protein